MKEIKSEKFHLFTDGCLHVFEYKLAQKLNNHYRRYMEDVRTYKFSSGEEAKFMLTELDYEFIIKRYLKVSLRHKETSVNL
jgi:hypothetical protein